MSAEDIKIASDYLGGTIGEELGNDEPTFGHDAEMLLKFHGIYQQDDRDIRRARTQQKLPLDYSCMVRASVPGGAINAEQWLALDRLASLADDKMRLTTRQGVQYHVVHKGELHELVNGINRSLLTTLGACGDVVRNVMACPFPEPRRQAILQPVIDELLARFRPRTESYWEVWVDGERAVSAEPRRAPGLSDPPANRSTEQPVTHPARRPRPAAIDPIDEVEPIYGAAYLPRKFKFGIAWPGDNCIDVYANDVGIVPTLSEGTDGELTGFLVLAGGGMGMSHSRPDDTYPLLAQPVGWVVPDALGDTLEAILTTQRDHGNRHDRSRARLKYLVEERGIAWLRDQVEQRTGRPLGAPVEPPAWEQHTHHGWHDVDATSVLGLPVGSGKVQGGLRTALRELVAGGYVTDLRVTSRQDLLLLGVHDRAAVESILHAHGVALAGDQSPTRNLSISCVALPTCAKALGEAERVLPDVVDRLEVLLEETGNVGLPLRVNMTGCPNGCARPYAAELGIVGRTKKNYDIYVGGSDAGDRLARCLRPDVPLTDVPDLIRPLLEKYSTDTTVFADGTRSISFGEWCFEQDWEWLQALLPEPTSRRRRRAAQPVGAS